MAALPALSMDGAVTFVRFGLALLLGALSAYVACCNAWIVWLQQRRRGRAPSIGPFLGGAAGVGAVLVAPVAILAERWPWSLLPLVLDVGSIPFLVLVLVAVARRPTTRDGG